MKQPIRHEDGETPGVVPAGEANFAETAPGPKTNPNSPKPIQIKAIMRVDFSDIIYSLIKFLDN